MCSDVSVRSLLGTHLLRHRCRELSRDTKVRQFDLPFAREENVCGWCERSARVGMASPTLDISMQLALTMQVLQSPEQFPRQNRNVLFAEHAGFHLWQRQCAWSSRSRRDSPDQSTSLPSSTP